MCRLRTRRADGHPITPTTNAVVPRARTKPPPAGIAHPQNIQAPRRPLRVCGASRPVAPAPLAPPGAPCRLGYPRLALGGAGDLVSHRPPPP
eukprot:6158650-Prymnesium_polylepis.1